MKKALVLGASGLMGRAIVYELVERGIAVTAFARNKRTLESLFGELPQVTIFCGDIFDKEELLRAVEGNDVIFHAINIPYPLWADKQPALLANILEVGEIKNAKLVIVDNIYAYGQSNGSPVTEDYTKKPKSKKGAIRLELETSAKQSKVPVLIAHFPDFYGPGGQSSLLNYTFKAMVDNKFAVFVGSQKVAREYIYTPDGAEALVNLAFLDEAYGQNWNIPGSGTITGREIVKIAKDITGYTMKVRTITKPIIRLLGIWDSMMREYVEMYYLNETPLVLSGEKYEQTFGKLPRTSYEKGIRKTIESLRERENI